VRAERAVATHRFTEAAALYHKHLRQEPQDHAARVALGALLKSTDARRAIGLLEDVPPEAPEYPAAQRHIAEIALIAGDDSRSEQALLVLLRKSADDYAVRLSLAELYHRQKKPKDALPHALRCAELKPDRIQTWLLIAEIYDDQGHPNEMISPLRRALVIDPQLLEAHLNLSYALVWSGATSEGRQEAEWCLARDSANVAARRLLALCERDDGHPEEALVEIRRALESAPDDLECRLVEAQILLFLRRGDEALLRLKPLLPKYANERRLQNLAARAAAAANRERSDRKSNDAKSQVHP
jgi:predicted Zn-dependent protease